DLGERARLYISSDPQPSEDTRTESKEGGLRPSRFATLRELRDELERWMQLDLDVEVERVDVEYGPGAESTPRTVWRVPERIVELAWLRLHVYPHIGQKTVDTITAGDVREILIGLAEQGVSRDLVVH